MIPHRFPGRTLYLCCATPAPWPVLVLQLPWLLLGCEFLERWHLQCQALASCSNPGLWLFTGNQLTCVFPPSCLVVVCCLLSHLEPPVPWKVSILRFWHRVKQLCELPAIGIPRGRRHRSESQTLIQRPPELSGNIHPTFAHISPALGCGADTLATAVAEAA